MMDRNKLAGRTDDYDFFLPEELIAQTPLTVRSDSRLLVLSRENASVSHHRFTDILDYLQPGDCLVLNDSRVIPARLIGEVKAKGAAVEILLLTRKTDKQWEILTKPGKKAKIGAVLSFGGDILTGTIIDILENGNRLIEFEFTGIFEEILDELGSMPLPPYIHERLEDKERYQTVYSKHNGSSAAPTAGLHFTRELLAEIQKKGVRIAFVTLHVGLGTFRPVKVEDILQHHMHAEYCWIKQADADIINQTKRAGGKIIAVGTTACRTLESLADANGWLEESSKWTDIFIYPGYQFKVLDGLITNFHLPKSTLIMLVSAFASREFVLSAYAEAVKEKYRFFSFGDAMLII